MKPCPRCESPLEETRVGTVFVDGCNHCGGVWFDHKEIDAVAKTSQLAYADYRFQPVESPQNLQHNPRCPVCRVELFAFQYPHSPGIILDACPQCSGIWTDDGEAQAIFERLTSIRSLHPLNTTRQKARQAFRFLTSQRCPNCQEGNPRGSGVCWKCGAAMPPGLVTLCPLCDVTLNSVHFGDRVMESCPECCGIWIYQTELAMAVKTQPDAIIRFEDALGKPIAPKPAPDARFDCPRCNQKLASQNYAYSSGIQIALCSDCDGAWLNHGDLARMATYLRERLP